MNPYRDKPAPVMEYKFVCGNTDLVGATDNERLSISVAVSRLAADGWRPVSMACGETSTYVVVMLEREAPR